MHLCNAFTSSADIQERQRLTPWYTGAFTLPPPDGGSDSTCKKGGLAWLLLASSVTLPPPDGGPASTCKRWACLLSGFHFHRLVGLLPPAKSGIACFLALSRTDGFRRESRPYRPQVSSNTGEAMPSQGFKGGDRKGQTHQAQQQSPKANTAEPCCLHAQARAKRRQPAKHLSSN